MDKFKIPSDIEDNPDLANYFGIQLWLGEGSVSNITVTEFRLLQGLIENKNQVLSRNQLMDLAYPDDNYASDRSIDSHIKRLRRKLGNEMIETVYGAGYKFVE